MVGPDSTDDEKQRRIRWLYRRHRPQSRWTPSNKLIIDQAQQAEQLRIVQAEYVRLYGELDRDMLAHVLSNVWTEARELAGWTYDLTRQCYRRADGSVVVDDDGSEWKHL